MINHGVRGIMYRDVVVAANGSVTCPRQLAGVTNLKTMCEPELVARDGALDHTGRRLGAPVGALARALRTDLVVAGHVAGGDVGAALGLAHGAVLQHQVPEHPRLAIVSPRTYPLLKLIDSRADRGVRNRRTLLDVTGLAVAPRRGVAEELLRLVAFRRSHVVLCTNTHQSAPWLIMLCAVLIS